MTLLHTCMRALAGLSAYLWWLIRTSVDKWLNDQCPRYGASLSYYAVLSLTSLLIFLVGLVGLFFGHGTAHQQLVHEAAALGPRLGSLVDALLRSAQQQREGLVASAMALGVLAVGATGVLVEMREVLDHIWRSKPSAAPQASFGQTLWRLVHTRLLTVLVLCAIGLLLLASLLASAFLTAMDTWLNSYLNSSLELAKMLHPLLSFIILLAFFAILMGSLPSRRPPWRMVLPGALLAALLFVIGKRLIRLYIKSSVITTRYGAAGTIVALMVWVYYSSQIVLLAAEFAWVLYHDKSYYKQRVLAANRHRKKRKKK